MNPDFLIPLKQVSEAKEITNGVLLKVDAELAEIVFLSEDIIRLRVSQGGRFLDKPSHACLDKKWPGAKFSISESEEKISIKSSKLLIDVDKAHFSPTVTRSDGSIILSGQKNKPFYQYQNNHFVTSRSCLPHEHIYGLGEKTGFLDRHGRTYTMWNKDVLAPDPDKDIKELIASRQSDPLATDFDPYYMSIPFYYRLHPETMDAAGYFIDNPYRSTYKFDNQKNHSHIEIHYEGGQYCEYIFADPQINKITQQYSELTGRIERPPLWSLGYHQCRWKKYSSEDLIGLAQKQRDCGVPCDVLWLDIDYMDEYCVFTWNDELFPDRESLFKKLKSMGFRIITIVDPGIKFEPGYEIFDQAKDNDLLCKCQNGQIYIGQVWPGKTAFPDFSKKECRQWWGELNAQHVKSGIAGIWNDMNEPATGEVAANDMLFAGDDNGQYSHQRYHNEYALLMAMATVEGLQKNDPNKRTFVLSRAGSPGIQRYAANWMGDNASRWEHLQMSLPMAMGLSLSGQPFIGADIGGFVEPTHPELFIRWMQCGAFYPFCRNHNDHSANQYAWSFGEATAKICKTAIDLRYQLLPYLYSQFVNSSLTGSPIFKPLICNYQKDPTVRQMDDQFLLGDDILVVPVLQPGMTTRTLYLPEGEWLEMNSSQKHCGPKWLSVDAPIDQIPWFIKCGSVIPMLPCIPESTMSLDKQELVLFLALPEAMGQFTSELHEDDGETTEFQQGHSLQTSFTLQSDKNKHTLTAKTTGIIHKAFQRKNFLLKLIGEGKVSYGKENIERQKEYYKIANSGEDFELTFK